MKKTILKHAGLILSGIGMALEIAAAYFDQKNIADDVLHDKQFELLVDNVVEKYLENNLESKGEK